MRLLQLQFIVMKTIPSLSSNPDKGTALIYQSNEQQYTSPKKRVLVYNSYILLSDVIHIVGFGGKMVLLFSILCFVLKSSNIFCV